MSESNESGPPPETRQQIMDATYEALREHGYADLTMETIADEFEKSQSLLHYHYDTKQDLLVAFVGTFLDRLVDAVESADADTPRERLDATVDLLLSDPEAHSDFQTALLELRSQAPYVEAYREQFVENDAHLRGFIADIVRDGVDAGDFADVDPTRVAETILVLAEGARTRTIVFDDDDAIDTTRAAVDGFIRSHVRAD
ncbi:TetR/AcrR family transcriptional regulator [Halocalculus aciditolerans]|uniref:HTH tetR-type domain-containing protein n=1 Tax=Halocalculus aciditolerans TaxID=1383812 RepID=A0A830FMP9_9EURY|nr:TetR/AcrR family transcriptional regulator [Halocalculus aciditolerans]GGL67988.1 hypothetical protein GCM10009039_27460 [Halocalculus aciditolerans]